jgi:hypothetical protein
MQGNDTWTENALESASVFGGHAIDVVDGEVVDAYLT